MNYLRDFPHHLHTENMNPTPFTRAKIAQIDRTISTVAQLRKMKGYGGIKINWANDIPLIDGSGGGNGLDGSIFAKITGRSGIYYSFKQVAHPGSGVAADVDDGITGTISDGYAVEINSLATDDLFTPDEKIFRLFPNPVNIGTWEFEVFADGSIPPVIYGLITANASGVYTFTQVSGMITGTVRDVNGFNDNGLIGKYALMIPDINPAHDGDWLMGPWGKFVNQTVDEIATAECDGTAINISLGITETTVFYIGG